MSTLSVTRLRRFGPLILLAAAACSDLRESPPSNVDRPDGQGGSAGSQSTGGRGGSGGSASNDAPVAGTGGGVVDAAPNADGDVACNAGATRCAGAVVEVCTIAGAWVMKETCTAVCAAGACAGMCTPNSQALRDRTDARNLQRPGRVGSGCDGLPERLQRNGRVHRHVQARDKTLQRHQQPDQPDLRRKGSLGGRRRLSQPLLERQLRRRLRAEHQTLWRQQRPGILQHERHLGTGDDLPVHLLGQRLRR